MIIQFGGQTPLNLARALSSAGVPIIGTSVDTIEDAEDREKFKAAMTKIGLGSARSAAAHSMEEAQQVQAMIGFPSPPGVPQPIADGRRHNQFANWSGGCGD